MGSTSTSADVQVQVQVQVQVPLAHKAADDANVAFGLAFGSQPGAVRAAFAGNVDFVVSGNDAILLAAAATALVTGVRAAEDGEG